MFFAAFLPLIGLVVACPDDEQHNHNDHGYAHVHAKREYPQVPLTPPYRPLVWGDFNVIHTTDTHGWLLGHQKSTWPEPNYSGDLGDFASFVTQMKQIAVEKDVDLLLVDSGDDHDGTGLSDGYPPGGVDAHNSNQFLQQLPYDLMTIGNHELYVYADTYDMYTNFVPQLNGRYLSSNANITVFNSNGEVVSVPVGNRYVTFTTAKGRTVTSLGVLYDFKGNSANTTVQTAADMVNEQWFAEAIAEEPDVFLLVGHMPVSKDIVGDYATGFGVNINGLSILGPTIFNAIRDVHPYTPILIFGGHTHIRDCQQYDGRSMALESGRYMETIGWMSADLDAAAGNTNNVTFTRRYLDQNRVTYQYHTDTSNSTFDTSAGLSITQGLQNLAVQFDLGHLYGTAPQDYTMNQDPYPSTGNVLTLFITEAAPVALAIDNPRSGIPNLIISNSEELRYNVFQGPFTKNDQLTAIPFTDSFSYIPNVEASVAKKVLSDLNGGSTEKRSNSELWGRGHVEGRFGAWLQEMYDHQSRQTSDLTLGYVTSDGCPDAGDDTLHTALPYYSVPNYIGSNPPDVKSTAPIDLVFVSFIESEVLRILNKVQYKIEYTSSDVSPYSSTLVNTVLGLYAQATWN